MSPRRAIALSRQSWPQLGALAFALLLVAFAATAYAADCMVANRTHHDVAASTCCSDMDCVGGGCLSHVAHRDCAREARAIAPQPACARSPSKFFTHYGASHVTANRAPLVLLAQPPPSHVGPTIGRYADVYARTGRLLI